MSRSLLGSLLVAAKSGGWLVSNIRRSFELGGATVEPTIIGPIEAFDEAWIGFTCCKTRLLTTCEFAAAMAQDGTDSDAQPQMGTVAISTIAKVPVRILTFTFDH
jgi:hypothetical protein